MTKEDLNLLLALFGVGLALLGSVWVALLIAAFGAGYLVGHGHPRTRRR